jgi:hypothetical protein
MTKIDKAIWKRGREIFERQNSPKEVWGDSAARQTHTFPDRITLGSLTQTVIGEEKRAGYLDQARAELKAEADAHLAYGKKTL